MIYHRVNKIICIRMIIIYIKLINQNFFMLNFCLVNEKESNKKPRLFFWFWYPHGRVIIDKTTSLVK